MIEIENMNSKGTSSKPMKEVFRLAELACSLILNCCRYKCPDAVRLMFGKVYRPDEKIYLKANKFWYGG